MIGINGRSVASCGGKKIRFVSFRPSRWENFVLKVRVCQRAWKGKVRYFDVLFGRVLVQSEVVVWLGWRLLFCTSIYLPR